jgi:hypothetical protein
METEQRSMSMWLQSLPKKAFVVIFLVMMTLFGASIVIGIFGPQIYTRHTFSSWNCTNENLTKFDPLLCSGVDLSLNTTEWTGILHNMNKLNQQIRLLVSPANVFMEGIIADLTFRILITGVTKEAAETTVIFDSARTREISCPKNTLWCNNVYLIQIPFIDYTDYEFRISITESPKTGWVHDTRFTFEYVTTSYTLFELWFRFVFLVATFGMIIWFVVTLRKFKWRDWAIEQRWTSILLFCLLGYNNPFFPLTILAKGWFPIFLNECLTTTFFATLLLYWLVVFDGIRPESLKKPQLLFYGPKVGFIFVCWALTIALLTWSKVTQVDNPTHDAVTQLSSYLFLAIIMLLLVICYVFWMLYLVCRACGDMKGVNYLGSRIKFFAVYTICCMVSVIVGYTVAFLTPANNNAARFLSTISMGNLYLYVLMIMYIPSNMAKPGLWLQDRRQGMANLAEEAPSSLEGALPAETVTDIPLDTSATDPKP